MPATDLIIAAVYMAALLIFKKKEFLTCFAAFVITFVIAELFKELFSVNDGGIECLYFLILSAIWLACSNLVESNKIKIAIIAMSAYEMLCGIESFIWQFVQPVLTPVISNYIINVIFLHVVILSSIYRWGVKIERDSSYTINSFNNRIHH